MNISIIPKKHYHNHKLELRIGDWKKKFDSNYVNTIIALALNHCTNDNEFIINGYLITTENLYLVAKTDKKKFDETLHKIEHHINLLLKFLTPEKNKYEIDFYIDQDEIYPIIHERLFIVYPFKNDYLIKLITARKVLLPYYNPELETLKSLVQHHPYCSVIDYSGAIGPVQVILLEE